MNQGQMAEQQGALGMMASREKLWTERTDTEKLDTLRQQVVFLCRQSQEQNATIYKLMQHRHGPIGESVVPLVDNGANHPQGYRYRTPISLRDKE